MTINTTNFFQIISFLILNVNNSGRIIVCNSSVLLRRKTFRFSVFYNWANLETKVSTLSLLFCQYWRHSLCWPLILVSHNSIFPLGLSILLSILPGGIGSIIPGNNIMRHSGQGAGGTPAIEAVHHMALMLCLYSLYSSFWTEFVFVYHVL